VQQQVSQMSVNTEKKKLKLLSFGHYPCIVDGIVVNIHLLPFDGGSVLWVNSENSLSMNNLAVAMPSRFEVSTSQTLLGRRLDMQSSDLAKRLSKRTGQQIFVSYNLPENDVELLRKVEAHLITSVFPALR